MLIPCCFFSYFLVDKSILLYTYKRFGGSRTLHSPFKSILLTISCDNLPTNPHMVSFSTCISSSKTCMLTCTQIIFRCIAFLHILLLMLFSVYYPYFLQLKLRWTLMSLLWAEKMGVMYFLLQYKFSSNSTNCKMHTCSLKSI